MLTRKESFICVLVCPQFFMDLISLYTTSLPRQLGMNFASWSQRMGWGNGRVPQSVRHGRNPAGRLGASFYRQAERTSTTRAFGCDANASAIKHGFPEMNDETNLIQVHDDIHIEWQRTVHEAYYCTMQTCMFSNTHIQLYIYIWSTTMIQSLLSIPYLVGRTHGDSPRGLNLAVERCPQTWQLWNSLNSRCNSIGAIIIRCISV